MQRNVDAYDRERFHGREPPDDCPRCGEPLEECECPPEPTREDYLQDRADMAHSDEEIRSWR